MNSYKDFFRKFTIRAEKGAHSNTMQHEALLVNDYAVKEVDQTTPPSKSGNNGEGANED